MTFSKYVPEDAESCPVCDGSGVVGGEAGVECEECLASGWVVYRPAIEAQPSCGVEPCSCAACSWAGYGETPACERGREVRHAA